MVGHESNTLLKSVHHAGCCELCSKSCLHLERHHLRYRPEITIWLCHGCHFKVHHQPHQLSQSQLLVMLCRVYKPDTIEKYKQNLIRLLSLSHSLSYENEVAPSRARFLEMGAPCHSEVKKEISQEK